MYFCIEIIHLHWLHNEVFQVISEISTKLNSIAHHGAPFFSLSLLWNVGKKFCRENCVLTVNQLDNFPKSRTEWKQNCYDGEVSKAKAKFYFSKMRLGTMEKNTGRDLENYCFNLSLPTSPNSSHLIPSGEFQFALCFWVLIRHTNISDDHKGKAETNTNLLNRKKIFPMVIAGQELKKRIPEIMFLCFPHLNFYRMLNHTEISVRISCILPLIINVTKSMCKILVQY